MTVESATYINTLNAALPAHTDPLSEADSHMRLIKQVLKTTFPNVAGVVSASDVDLSAVTTLRTTVSGLITTLLNTASTWIAQQTFQGGINATTIQKNSCELVPTGTICMWYGSTSTVPGGWAQCDGANGTPDLTNCYIIGAGGLFTSGSLFGNFSQAVNTSTAGLHNHGALTGLAGGFTPTGSMDPQGSHYHTGVTGGHTLAVSELPAHDHGLTANGPIPTQPGSGGTAALNGGSGIKLVSMQSVGGNSPHTHPISTDGSHVHNLSLNAVPAHQHAISSDGSHTHTVTVPMAPPTCALVYIMKL